MSSDLVAATYLVETPLDPREVAEIMAGEQSCGTFVRVAGETDALRARAGASILSIEELEPPEHPTLSSAYLTRKGPPPDVPACNWVFPLPILAPTCRR